MYLPQNGTIGFDPQPIGRSGHEKKSKRKPKGTWGSSVLRRAQQVEVSSQVWGGQRGEVQEFSGMCVCFVEARCPILVISFVGLTGHCNGGSTLVG